MNRLGDSVKPSKENYFNYFEKVKPVVTTYKPKISLKDIKESVIEEEVTHKFSEPIMEQKTTIDYISPTEKIATQPKQDVTTYKSTTADVSPGDVDLGTGTPDSTIMDIFYSSPTTQASTIDRSDAFSFMDYLFGVTSPEENFKNIKDKNKNENEKKVSSINDEINTKPTETPSPTVTATESTFIPEEITASSNVDEETERILSLDFGDIKKINNTEQISEDTKTHINAGEINNNENTIVTSTASSYLDPLQVVSTSLSTEISHETEICFRGKCIKTNKDVLL